MTGPRRLHPSLASILLATIASIIPNTTPLQGQTQTRAGERYYSTLFVDAYSTWGIAIDTVHQDTLRLRILNPVMRNTPPWERVWETKYTFFPRVRLTDADGTVWEVVLNPHAVQAIVVAQDPETLQDRLNFLFGDQFDPVWLNLLDFVRTAQVEIRGFVPENPDDLDQETWTANVRQFVRYHPALDPDPIWVEGDSIAPGYLLGNIWPAVVESIEGYWVDHLVKVAHSVYKVEGHNPPDDHCIKLSNCMLFCDNTRRN